LKIFISSVTYLLNEERNALPPFLSLFNHEGLRFEDFASQSASSREACLAGVAAADVYVLLLGPRYGNSVPDSQMAPTAEEFTAARNRGIPILVFNKSTDEPDDAAQAAFKAIVGDYVNGRFWKSFTDPLSLNQAVGEALKGLRPPGGPLRLVPVREALQVPWRTEQAGLRPRHVTAPVLELHLLPTDATEILSAGALAVQRTTLARDVRSTGFVTEDEPLEVSSDNAYAWAIRPPETAHSRTSSPVGRSAEAWRGASVAADGTATGWVSLPTDMFGALLDEQTAREHVAILLGLLRPHVSVATASVAFAVRLAPAGQVQEGDPAQVGSRNSGTFGFGTQNTVEVRLEPDFAVTPEDLRSSGDVAAEISTRLINDLRKIKP
jgi:hypothetical protein